MQEVAGSIPVTPTSDSAVEADLGTTLTGTATFADGASTANISVDTIDDSLVEGSEQFVVTISNPTNSASLGSQTTSTVTITDNDTAPVPGTIAFTSATGSVTEGGTASLELTPSGVESLK